MKAKAIKTAGDYRKEKQAADYRLELVALDQQKKAAAIVAALNDHPEIGIIRKENGRLMYYKFKNGRQYMRENIFQLVKI